MKGERCFSAKCAMVKRPYPAGQKRKRRRSGLSEYAKELREKQKLKNWYNLRERQFKKYVKQALSQRGRTEDAATLLIRKLETRLDNVVFRLGFAPSRPKAKQLVSHRHFLVNKKAVNIPSLGLRKGDKIGVRPASQKKGLFKNLLKKHEPPAWLKFDSQKLEAEVVAEPSLEEAAPPAEISSIFEYYSR